MSAAVPFPPASGGDDTLGPQIIAASWVLTSLSAAFLCMRVSAKLWTGRALLVDDYILFVAWLAVLVPSITSTLAVKKGLGMHVFAVSLEDVPWLALLINTTVSILIFAAALSKTSFAITVLRLVKGYMRAITWFIMISTNIVLGVNIIFLWVNFEKIPNTAAPSPSQISLAVALAGYGIAATSYSAAMDFALVAISWSVVSKLQMRSTREKVGLGVALSMGVVAGATSIVKAAILPTLAEGDITYTSASLHIWSIAEPSVTIMAASIPLLRVLFSHVRKMRTSANNTNTGSFATTTTTTTTRPGYGRSRSLGGSVKHATVGSIPVLAAKVVSSGGGGSSRPPYEYEMYGVPEEVETSDKSVMLDNLQEIARTMSTEERPDRDVERGERWSEIGDGTTLRSSTAGSGLWPQERKYTQYAHTGERLTTMPDHYVVEVSQFGPGSKKRLSELPGQAF